MDKKIIKNITLKNGLVLKIIDDSRKVAGDRWNIVIFGEIEIPIDKEFFPDEKISIDDIEDIRKELGNSVFFSKQRKRIFIDEKEKDEILQNMVESFIQSLFPYLSHEKFPGNTILYMLKEKRKRQGN